MEMDDLLRAGTHTHAAGNTFFLVHHCHAVFIRCNGAELTDRRADSAAHAAISAF